MWPTGACRLCRHPAVEHAMLLLGELVNDGTVQALDEIRVAAVLLGELAQPDDLALDSAIERGHLRTIGS